MNVFKISLHFKFSEFTFKGFPFSSVSTFRSHKKLQKKSWPWSLYRVCPFPLVAPCAIVTTTSPCRDFLQPARCFVGKDTTKNMENSSASVAKGENTVFTGIFNRSDQLAEIFFHLQYHPSLGLWVYLIALCIQLSPTCPKEFRDTATSLTSFIWINFTYIEGFYLSLLWETCHMTPK